MNAEIVLNILVRLVGVSLLWYAFGWAAAIGIWCMFAGYSND